MESADFPHSLEAEMGLLGGVMVDNRAYDRMADTLREGHFFDRRNGAVYAAIQEIIGEGKTADPITLKRFFPDQQDLGPFTVDPGYLSNLAACAVTPINAGEYAHLVTDYYHKRMLILAAESLIENAAQINSDDYAPAIQEAHERTLFELAELGTGEQGPRLISEYAEQAMAAVERARTGDGVAGLSTGLIDLDALLGGLHPTDLIICAGRPSMGKTAFATTIGFHVAKTVPVLGFSLEMSGDQLALREIGGRAGVSSHKLRLGSVDMFGIDDARTAAKGLRDLPFWIDDRASLTIEGLRSTARRMKRKAGIGLIIVDYLQLLTSKGENRVQEIQRITQGLKATAKELGVPVLALSQLSRLVEQRTPPRPQLSDLRESGSIEQDADTALLIYREAYYHERKRPQQKDNEDDDAFETRKGKWLGILDKIEKKAEVIVAKQRHGPCGTVDLHFSAMATRFENSAEDQDG